MFFIILDPILSIMPKSPVNKFYICGHLNDFLV